MYASQAILSGKDDHIRKKILIGMVEVASVISELAIAFRNEGYHTDNIVVGHNFFYKDHTYTYTLNNYVFFRNPRLRNFVQKVVKSVFFIYAICKYDYFIYVWSDTYLPLRLDQFLLKIAGKPFCLLYCGSELRYRPIALKCEEKKFRIRRFTEATRRQYLLESGQSGIRDFVTKVVRTTVSNLLTENIFSSRSVSTFSSRSVSTLTLKPFYNQFQPIFIDTSLPAKKNGRITIVHAPSNSVNKNSEFIIESVEELRSEGFDFDFVLLRKQPNHVVLSTLAASHIAIDQIAALPGRFAMEAMALGCAVLGGNKHYYERQCDEIPVIDIILDKTDLKNKIVDLLNDRKKIAELGEMGKQYIEKYHNGKYSVHMLIDALEGRSRPDQTPVWDSKDELLSYCERWYEKALVRLMVHA
jgi:hypothetical protein